MELYFRDNFFNAGYTEIMNHEQERAGHLDLKSAFGSSLDVFDNSGLICSGKFRMFSNRWDVTSADGREWGVLRARFSFFSKKYEYMQDRVVCMMSPRRRFHMIMISPGWAVKLWQASGVQVAGSVQAHLC
ncbi:hypothetical protein DET54_110222 [Paenibacillus pabuli]|uniref:Uncharacterized protein n=1 Tax=Paenibacillus pabuli TaxID=1472 RepID=A0ABX9BHE2_9BACL|nr:hypothetical protein [Paenibacillus pabuli]RAI92514.1 hypothetical protein DET54_110222 [Paenibacillus pabuli]